MGWAFFLPAGHFLSPVAIDGYVDVAEGAWAAIRYGGLGAAEVVWCVAIVGGWWRPPFRLLRVIRRHYVCDVELALGRGAGAAAASSCVPLAVSSLKKRHGFTRALLLEFCVLLQMLALMSLYDIFGTGKISESGASKQAKFYTIKLFYGIEREAVTTHSYAIP